MRPTLLLFGLLSCLLANAQEGVVRTYQSPVFNKIEHVVVSSDSQTIIAADSAGYIFYWNKEDGALTKIMRAHNHALTYLVLSSDGKYLATCSKQKNIFLWDFNTGTKTAEVFLETPCTGLAFTQDNSTLLYSTEKEVYRSAIAQQLKNPVKIYQSKSSISCGASVSKGMYFAVNVNESLFLLSSEGTEKSKVKCCSGIQFLESNGNEVSAICRNGTLQLFELKDGTLHEKKQTSLSFNHAQGLLLPTILLVTSENGGIQIWDLNLNQVFNAEGLPKPVTTLGNAGQFILAGNTGGQVMLCKPPYPGEAVKQDAPAQPSKSPNSRKVHLQNVVEVQSPQLDIYVWDDENVDGDTISLSLNGEWIVEKYMVTKEKRKITITLQPDKKNTLLLYAENLGRIPPNTAVISFNDGTKERTITLNSDLERSDAVNFILKK